MPHSLAQQASLNCPQCARSFTAVIWLIVDASERPDLFDHIQAGTLHDLPCPHCGHAGQIDAPILLYRPGSSPPLIFSPAQETTAKQDREQAEGLLGYLYDVLGNAWCDEWLEAMPAIPREFLPVALSNDLEVAISQMAMQAEQDFAQLRQENPDAYGELEAAARLMTEEVTDVVTSEHTTPTVPPLFFTIQQFIQTDSWLESYGFVQAHPELLGSEASILLDDLMHAIQAKGSENARRIFDEHRILLYRCQEIGITEAFAEKLEVPVEALTAQSEKNHPSPAVPPQFQANIQQAQMGEQRYVQRGDQRGLDEAVTAWEFILQHPTFPQTDYRLQLAALNNIGRVFLLRYWEQGQLADLTRALELCQLAVQRTPSDSPHLPSRLNNLGNSLRARYALTGHLADLEEAIRVAHNAVQRTLPDSPDLPAFLNNLGNGLRDRYVRTGQLADLEEAISVYEAAVQHTPSDSPDLPSRLNNLGNGLRDRYGCTGQLTDLEKVIAISEAAVQLTPPNSPDLPGYLNNLGNGLSDCYARTGQLGDLEEAIRLYQTAVQCTASDSPHRPGYHTNLGSCLSDHYARTGQLADLGEAIRIYRTAVQRTLPDSPELPSRLNNLGSGLSARYARTGQLADLEEAISVARNAVQRTPTDSSELPRNLNNLGNSLRTRYARTGQLADLEEAISVARNAVQRTPSNSPDRAGYLNNLGNSLSARYARNSQQADLDAAIAAYEQACLLGRERQPEIVILAARSWGQWALTRRAWDEANRAYKFGLTGLEQLYQTQLLQHEQQSWQREGQGLYAQTAYALARIGEFSAAAVALEHGQARGLNDRLARDEADLLQVQQQSPALFQQYQAAAARLRQLEAGERQKRLTGPGVTTPPDWAVHRQQVQQARTDLQAAIAAIRQLDGYDQFLLPPRFEDVATTVHPGHSLAYLITTLAGSLGLLLHRPTPTAEVAIETLWANAFTTTDLNAFLVKRENGEVSGGYLPGQFFGDTLLRQALADGLPLLGEALLAPLAQRLQALGLQRVTLIPGGRLNLLPLHAATVAVNGQPAIFGDLFAISYAPSARALSLSYHRRQDYEALIPHLLTVGNPLPLSDGVRPLPYARLEAEEIARRFGQGAHLVCAEAATHTAITTAMPGHTHLHFACHGQFDPKNPLESGLLLGGSDTLTLRQILDDITLRGVRLAVLSACQTAISDYKELPDEVIGLPAAFLQAGAAGVLSSLWPVNDLSTMLLMDRFYHLHLDEGVETAIALQRAQRWLREVPAGELFDRFGREAQQLVNRMSKEQALEYWYRFEKMEKGERPFADPYYWAAFTFTGA